MQEITVICSQNGGSIKQCLLAEELQNGFPKGFIVAQPVATNAPWNAQFAAGVSQELV